MTKKSTEQTYLKEIEKICCEKSYVFHGFSGDYVGASTKLVLECHKHSFKWGSTRLSDFRRGNGCPKCGAEATKKNLTKPDSYHIDTFMASGKFDLETKFWRSDRVGPKNSKPYWNYSCNICSEDEFVLNNLCSGIFESYSGSLQKGIKSCRCSPNYAFTESQQIHRISKLLEGNPKYKFLGWSESYIGRTSYLNMSCAEHSTWKTMYGDLQDGHGCPACAVSGYDSSKEGTLYVLLAKSDGGESFTGYGITNVIENRLQQHKYNLLKSGFKIAEIFTVKTTGVDALNAERLIKKSFIKNSQQIKGFITEATLAEHFLDVVSLVKSHLGDVNGCKPPCSRRENHLPAQANT